MKKSTTLRTLVKSNPLLKVSVKSKITFQTKNKRKRNLKLRVLSLIWDNLKLARGQQAWERLNWAG
jgi:phage terminase large subunit-like protein